MEHIILTAESRTTTGKAVRRLRQDGIIPVVVYGGPLTESLSLQVDQRELGRVLTQAGTAKVIDLKVESTSYPVLTREVQRDPIRQDITHVDFLAVRLDQLIEAEIPVLLVGTSQLVNNNEAILMHAYNSLTVRALPEELPSQIEVDISSLTEIGQSITVSDLPLAEGVEIMTDPDSAVVSLMPPTRAVTEEVEPETEEGEIEYGDVSAPDAETEEDEE